MRNMKMNNTYKWIYEHLSMITEIYHLMGKETFFIHVPKEQAEWYTEKVRSMMEEGNKIFYAEKEKETDVSIDEEDFKELFRQPDNSDD